VLAVLDTGHHPPLGRPVARELICDHDAGALGTAALESEREISLVLQVGFDT
jgi:hypothetical protein